MGKIFYLIGKSAVGKDSLLEKLLNDEKLELKPIVQYTTRPIRDGEEEGREYHFITNERADELNDEGKIVEMRAYSTIYGIWKYMLVDDGQMALEKENYSAVGTVASYVQVRNYYGDAKVIPIYIDVETGERLQRALNRERTHKQPKYTELCRRFLADEEDFSDEHLKEAGLLTNEGKIINCVENIDFETCYEEIRAIILKNKEK